MKKINTGLLLLIIVVLFNSCTTYYEDEQFALEAIGFSITLPGNARIEYDAPSHNEDQPRYDIYYNDGNTSHNAVAISLENVIQNYPKTLKILKEIIEEKEGVVLKEYLYDNGFFGCTYTKDGSRLFRFVKINPSGDAYVITPHEIYNNKHEYLSVLLDAIESIGQISA